MATFEIGIRIDPAKGIAYFGVEELNQRLAAGARIVEVRPGGAIVSRVGAKDAADSDNVRMTLSGCQFQVVVEDA